MKLTLLFLTMLVTSVCASHIGLMLVKQPVYLFETDYDPMIRIVDVPYVTRSSDPEWRFSAICRPFVPATDGGWKEPHDVNLTSLYGIKVSGTYKKDSRDIEVVIDASKAAVPLQHPFTIDQVVDATTTCVKLMYPAKPETEGKLVIKVVPPKPQTQESADGDGATQSSDQN